MNQRLGWVWAFATIGMFGSGCYLLFPHTETASAANGSRTADGYDRTDTQLEAATQAASATDSAHLLQADEMATQAATTARDTLAMVDQMQHDGTWRSGLKYAVRGGKVLSESEILAALATMRKRAKHMHKKIEANLDEAYGREYPDASAAQLTALHTLGPPTTVALRPPPLPPPPRGATKRPRPRPTVAKAISQPCWTWDREAALTTTCWNADGTVASQVEKAKPPPPPSGRGAGPRGAGAQRNTGESEVTVEFYSACEKFACGEVGFADGGWEGCWGPGTSESIPISKLPATLTLYNAQHNPFGSVVLAALSATYNLDFDCHVQIEPK
jgi:hypothetical protein